MSEESVSGASSTKQNPYDLFTIVQNNFYTTHLLLLLHYPFSLASAYCERADLKNELNQITNEFNNDPTRHELLNQMIELKHALHSNQTELTMLYPAIVFAVIFLVGFALKDLYNKRPQSSPSQPSRSLADEFGPFIMLPGAALMLGGFAMYFYTVFVGAVFDIMRFPLRMSSSDSGMEFNAADLLGLTSMVLSPFALITIGLLSAATYKAYTAVTDYCVTFRDKTGLPDQPAQLSPLGP